MKGKLFMFHFHSKFLIHKLNTMSKKNLEQPINFASTFWTPYPTPPRLIIRLFETSSFYLDELLSARHCCLSSRHSKMWSSHLTEPIRGDHSLPRTNRFPLPRFVMFCAHPRPPLPGLQYGSSLISDTAGGTLPISTGSPTPRREHLPSHLPSHLIFMKLFNISHVMPERVLNKTHFGCGKCENQPLLM